MSHKQTPEQLAVLWPGGINIVPRIEPAPRLANLNGKTIAFVWDYMFRGDEIFPMLESLLAENHMDLSFVGYETFGSTFGGDEHEAIRQLPELLRKHNVDAVVSGIGC